MRRVLALFSSILIGLVACSDGPTEGIPASGSPASAPMSMQVGDVPAVTMDLPPEPRPWDTSESALAAAVAEQDGHAVIAFKEPGSMRVLPGSGRTGTRGAVSAATIRQGIEMLRSHGVQVVSYYRSIGAAWVRVEPALAGRLRSHPLVDYVEPRQWARMAGEPAAPTVLATMMSLTSSQTTPWGITMVRAPEAWSVSTGSGVKVQIIDSGHYQGHEDLPAVPSGNCGGAYGGCDDGPSLWHGTHVLGIFTARNNSVGVVGVAPEVSDLQVYSWGACDSSTGGCSTTEVTGGIDASVSWGIDVLNMSLGGPYDAGIANSLAVAWDNDMVLVAAAGNNGGETVVYPAGDSHVIGVSGVKTDGSFADSSPCGGTSNYGSHVDLSAPFWGLSTVGNNGYGDETAGYCGTSMASPHVAGVAALLRAKYPTMYNYNVYDQLFNTAQDRGASGWDKYYGYGIVDAAKALGVLDVSISGPTWIDTEGTYTWEAMPSGGDGSYTYQWSVYWHEWGSWQTLGTGKTQSLYVTEADGDFDIKVAVTSAGQSASDQLYVNNTICTSGSCPLSVGGTASSDKSP